MADSYSFPTDDYVLVGKIVKAHGLKGEMKILTFSEQPQNIKLYRHLVLVSEQGRLTSPFSIVTSRVGNKETAIVGIEGVTDRNTAESLCGYGVLVRKDELPPLDGNEFYLYELEGLQVITDEGRSLGTVQAFLNNGAQDILVVRNGNDEFLIPLIPGMIVDRDENVVTIAPPPGLIDINSDESEPGNTSQ